MESHAKDDSSITTDERCESNSKSNMYITSENSSDEEIYPWITLINDTATKVRAQYHDMLQALLMKSHDENEAKYNRKPLRILPVLQKELADVYMAKLAWMKALKKDPIHKKIMATRDYYVDKNVFDPGEAIAAVDKRKFLLKRLLEDQGRFSTIVTKE